MFIDKMSNDECKAKCRSPKLVQRRESGMGYNVWHETQRPHRLYAETSNLPVTVKLIITDRMWFPQMASEMVGELVEFLGVEPEWGKTQG